LLAEIYQGLGENDKAMEVYSKLIERNPENSSVQLSLCDFLLNSKQYEDLFILLNTISLNENISREDKISLFARILESEDVISNKENNLLRSVLVLEASYPSDDIIPLLRVDLLIRINRISDAGKRLEEIVRKNPDNYYAWEKLLLVYLQERDFPMLEKRGEEAAKLFNRSFIAKILYANGAMENMNYKVALEELRKATILASDDKEMNIQILTIKADIYYRMKDFGMAFETFEEAMKISSEDLTIINNYAYYLAEQNIRLKEAEAMAEKVIEKERSNVSFLDTYGWILYKRGKVKAAGKIMEEIISGNEQPGAEIFEHYGYILKKQNKCEKAIENWEIAMKLDTTKNNLIIEIENCLRER
jgi:Tfp pilus assembly protein PilF